MPLFYFDFTSDGNVMPDDIGLDFASLEEAYLETCRAALEICFEKFERQHDPHQDSFDILDQERHALMHVPFSEVLRLRSTMQPAVPNRIVERCRHQIARNRALRAEIWFELQRAHSALAAMRANVARLKTLSRTRLDRGRN